MALVPSRLGGPVGYVLDFFPQLSETFVENELLAMQQLGEEVLALSMYRPAPDLAAPTALDRSRLEYRPNGGVLTAHFVAWLVRRPAATTVNVARALGLRSQTMLRGAWSAGWAASRLRRVGATHVHAHFAHDAACTGLAAAGLLRLPFTFTLHAHELYLRTNGLCLRCDKADRVVTVCDYNVRQLLSRCPDLRRDHIEVVYCGVDPGAFTFRPSTPSQGPIRLLSVGRLVPQKGFADLVRAVRIVTDHGVDVVCEIVGHGPLHQELAALIEELELRDRITLAGPLPPAGVAARMAACDVFVLAARIDEQGNRDSMPVVIKEAMATGRPVVSTDEVGIPEMVDDEVGRLVPPDDPAALAEGIEQLACMGAAERDAIGQRGRKRVEERFNLHTETARLRDLMARLATA